MRWLPFGILFKLICNNFHYIHRCKRRELHVLRTTLVALPVIEHAITIAGVIFVSIYLVDISSTARVQNFFAFPTVDRGDF